MAVIRPLITSISLYRKKPRSPAKPINIKLKSSTLLISLMQYNPSNLFPPPKLNFLSLSAYGLYLIIDLATHLRRLEAKSPLALA